MYLVDYHCHTNWSFDGKNSIEEMVIDGINKGLSEIAFTDHYDFVPDKDRILFPFDEYIEEIERCKKIYNNKIEIKLGVEVGIQIHNINLTKELISNYPFDFVLASTHRVDKLRPAVGTFFKGKDKITAYTEYFQYLLDSISIFDDFDSYGHLDYVVRYGTYENKDFKYHEMAHIIDKVLLKLIEMGKGIEINTSRRRKGDRENHPTREIVARYKELGGDIITVGSDGHNIRDLGTYIEDAYTMLKELGFEYITTFKNRKPIKIFI